MSLFNLSSQDFCSPLFFYTCFCLFSFYLFFSWRLITLQYCNGFITWFLLSIYHHCKLNFDVVHTRLEIHSSASTSTSFCIKIFLFQHYLLERPSFLQWNTVVVLRIYCHVCGYISGISIPFH